LQSFVPGPQLTPGRMNIFQFRNFNLMIDYAHNTDGYYELRQFMQQVPATTKIGVIGCPGDRRDEDLVNMGFHSAQMFDEIIIKHDEDPRGRTNDNITQLLNNGIRKANSSIKITVISNEVEAIKHAMANAPRGAFIAVCSDDVKATLAFVGSAHEEDMRSYKTVTA
jgi:cyanophycin synthetase